MFYYASNAKPQIFDSSLSILDYIVQNKIASTSQIDYALAFFMQKLCTDFSSDEFEKACGIGITISTSEIKTSIEKCAADLKSNLNSGKLTNMVFKDLKFADRLIVKNHVDEFMKTQPLADAKAQSSAVKKEKRVQTYEQLFEDKSKFHLPGENYKTDGYKITDTTMQHMKEHLKRTGVRYVTRFPPEPNGMLHIGHSKAILLDFGLAKYFNGHCYLRFDDTNPEKEEKRFMDEIISIVDWFGFTPYKITHSSDYFDKIYDYAVQLIKKDLAYVCHMTKEEVRDAVTEKRPDSPWRSRPWSESLEIFEQMRGGKFEEGKATLRLKYTMPDGKKDPVIYRIMFTPHPKTGKKWCIYPAYDFAHCLCDSIEDISHSMCSKEFQTHR